MEEKLERVTLWLKKKYGNEPIPEYKVNEGTVDTLYDLAECDEAREKNLSLLVGDMKQMAAEYEAKAKYLESILGESLHLSPSSLSSEAVSDLNILVDSAMTLDTKDTSLTSFFVAINDVTLELYTTESKNKEMEQELIQMKKKLIKALLMEKRLDEDIKKAEEILELEKYREESHSWKLKFIASKSEELKVNIKAAEEQLTATGLDQSLTHESLFTLSQGVARMKEEMVPVKKELEAYCDLAPNPTLAQVKIEEVKRELEALEAEFSECIEGLTLEMA
ncbi:HAUS augmin-like complex, subunit 1 [Columba livia]|uniref:HAUS augmin-like complex, subunit 1 n=1 Tax=Columba livia TaxID=8932 RepID=A0A2I0M0K7_COLLI|nr:HAUS augmin-like complex, subunit 1 [Columba livia]